MQLTHHPEFQPVYLPTREAAARCRQAIAHWQADDAVIHVDAYDLTWTVDSARTFVRELAQMFGAYNRVLWERFSYCAQCGGQCCVVDASDVRPFDLIAVALLDETDPELPDRIKTGVHGCIYLAGTHCSWPDAWRTIKCWTFYCLGSGPWDPSLSLHELYCAVTEELVQVVQTHLPAPLRRYESLHDITLAGYLDDPVAFSNALHNVLDALFVAPLHARYPLSDGALASTEAAATATQAAGQTDIALVDPDILTFILSATEQLSTESADSADENHATEQMLDDLETLEWIVMGRPGNGRQLLLEMGERYDAVNQGTSRATRSIARPLRQHIAHLLEHDF